MRKSISVTFFSTTALLLILGICVMGLSQMYLFAKYFGEEKYNTGDKVAALALTALEQAQPADGKVTDDATLDEKITLIARTADLGLLYTDDTGAVLFCAGGDAQSAAVPAQVLSAVTAEASAGSDAPVYYHALSDLGGVLSARCYVTAAPVSGGYVFIYSPANSFSDFAREMFSNFVLSASLMLLCASLLTVVLSRRMTEPLHKISEAAQKFGGGDLTTRVEGVDGDDEVGQLAANFNVMAANLESIDNSRSQFMGNIAHELRTPMTTIKGFIDGMLDGTIPPELQPHYLQIVSQEVGRLARLVQNMLDITKLESGEYEMHARLYNIWDTITGAALSAEQRITAGKIELEGLDADNQLLVYADSDLVHQVVYNLLDNAIKFTPPGGVIRFSAQRLGPDVEIGVWNSGQGISPEALPFVFERFYKEDKSRGLNARGSGLGLHICKVLINLSGGQIRVESKQGEWCKFTFTLPAELPNRRDLLKLADQTDGADGKKKKER